jgi:tRNA(adenine34) deaminase
VTDEDIMRVALEEARRALEHGDVPIGAVMTRGDEIVARAHNQRELTGDPTAHAEVLALRAAAELAGSWRLDGTAMYVTLEPCSMCAGALVLARVDRLVYGPLDPRAGAALSLYNIPQDPRLNHEVAITTGILEEDCAELLHSFFQEKRGGGGI